LQFHNGMPAAALTGVTWRKSTHSGCLGNCVETAVVDSGEVALRNSRDPHGPALIFSHTEMAAFLAGAKDGEFDSLTTLATPLACAAVFENDPPRCDSVLGPIYSLAEDDQWHCQLPEGHEGLCQAPDGTTW
jgi:hypothetical protein